ncbi:hypothetical protein ACX6XY_04985 [Streptomyces sp. O3]
MDDIEPTPRSGATRAPDSSPSPRSEGRSTRQRTLDLIGMLALLGLSAGVYILLGDAGFSMVVGAVVSLYGVWRARR